MPKPFSCLYLIWQKVPEEYRQEKQLDNLSDKELVITESVAGRIIESKEVEDESSSTLF